MSAERGRRMAAGLAALAGLGALGAAPAGAQGAARAHVLIVSGVGGAPEYSTAFHTQAIAFMDALRTRFGVPASDITYLAENPARAPDRIAASSSKPNVEQAITAIAGKARAGDVVFILLLGHGSSQQGEARFNVPGPDITAADFARLLAPLTAPVVALVNASSASGEFIGALSGPNRVVVTATKSGMERNETKFGRFFVDAYAKDGADADKDGRVSVVEAFEYARREVVRAYERENHLLTEHAMLDDNGDGKGTAAPDGRTPDGGLARRVFLGSTAGSVASAVRGAAANDPRMAALEREKDALEARIDSLRRRKASMDSTAYERELEKLLVSLAEKNKEIRDATGRKP